MQKFRVLILVLGSSAALLASSASAQLPIPSAGVVADIAGASDKPDPARIYKLAFDVKSMPRLAGDISPALLGIARVINTLRHYGVPADHIQATVVFHGPTIVTITKDEIYRNRTGAKGNPNLDLIRQISAAGVRMVVCGVSASEQNYVAADLVPQASLNLSATFSFIDLGTRGYVMVER